MRLGLAVMGIAAVSVFASPLVRANSVTFGDCGQIQPALAVCPSVGNVGTGTNHLKYVHDGLTVTASAFYLNGNPIDLYVKHSSAPGETGLGTVIDADDHEITTQDFVNLDFSNLWAVGISSGFLTISSLQTSEGYKICQGSVVGQVGATCVTGGFGTLTTTIALSWTGTTDIFSISGYNPSNPAADVLLTGLTVAAPTPEPASLTLLGFGMSAVAGIRRKFGKK